MLSLGCPKNQAGIASADCSRALIPTGNKSFDCFDEHAHTGEVSAPQGATAQDAKPAFNLIEPTAVGGDMSNDEVNDLMSELRDWAERARYGEQTALAKLLGVPKQRVNHWITGRKIPNLRDGLKLQAFLKKQRRAKSRGTRQGS